MKLVRTGNESVIAAALVDEERVEREADREYWKPLKRELEESPPCASVAHKELLCVKIATC